MPRNYNTDGLIYTPENYAVASNVPGNLENTIENTGGTWDLVFKWKPPEQNTIYQINKAV